MNIINKLSCGLYRCVILSTLTITMGYTQSYSILFHDISVKNHLSYDRADTVHEDAEGYLWISNFSGTVKYDGFNFKRYSLDGVDFRIRSFFSDSKKRLWAISNIGLLLYNKNKDAFNQYQLSDKLEPFLTGYIYSFLEDADGYFWLSHASNKLIRFHHENKNVQVFDSPNQAINCLAELNTTTLVTSTIDGQVFLFKKQEKRFEKIDLKKPNIKAKITSIVIDEKKNIWIGTLGEGLYKYSYLDGSCQHFLARNVTDNKSINNNEVLNLFVDQNNNVWIGTDGGGLNLYDQGNNAFLYFNRNGPKKFDLTDNSIISISQGKNNIIWIGTVHGGVSYFKNNLVNYNIPLETFNISKAESQTWRVLEDRLGNLWLGVGRDGLRKYHVKTHQLHTYRNDPLNPNSLGGNIVISIFEDKKGIIWIGTYYGGLCLFDPVKNNFKHIKGTNIPWAIEEGPDGNIWVGTTKGVMVYNLQGGFIKQIKNFNNPNGRPYIITALKKDVKGNMWIGTPRGLFMQNVETGEVETYTAYKGDATLSGNHIFSIFEDSDLSIWVGTFKSGINLFDRKTKKFKRYGKEQGLKGNQIREIWEDNKKNIWASTNNGFSRINLDGKIVNFGLRDGIYPASPGHMLYSKEGKVIQGNMYGLNFYDLQKLKKDDSIPHMVFTEIEVSDKSNKRRIHVPSLEKTTNNIPFIELKPRTPNFIINFLAFDHLSPNNCQYMYKVEGLDGEWHNIGNQRNISFSFLPAGTYTLWVKGANSSGIWNNDGIKLQFLVAPTFFEQRYVQVLIVLLLIGLVFGTYKWRVHNIKLQKEKLKQLVALKTKELKKKQKEVILQKEKLIASEQANYHLKKKQLSDELSFKKSELTNNTLRSAHKSNLLQKIMKALAFECKQHNVDKNNLKSLQTQIKDTLKLDEDWNDFYRLFNEVHISFINNLKNHEPYLTKREIRFCALLKLNFSTNEIATLFGISPNSVKVSRYRLRQKLKLDSDTTFKTFFNKLEASTE